MKHKFKQVLSLALVFCMVMSLTCINVYATSGAETETTAADTVAEASEEVSTESTEAEATAAEVSEEEASDEEEISVASEEATTDDSSVTEDTTRSNKPSDGTTTSQPFSSGTGGSTYFRIPAMVTLDDGTIVAACDARWNTTSDGWCLDTIVSYSKDNGTTWNYTFANYLGDNGNSYNSSSTAFIDPCLATDGETVWMLVDLYPGGTAIGSAQAGTGYDSNGHLLLSSNSGSSYDYYVGDYTDGYASIYTVSGDTAIDHYTVDEYFYLYYDGTCISNVFFSDCTYTVLPTSYLYLTTSTDGGATWSAPTMLNSQVKNSDDEFYGVGPGSGLVITLEDGTQRILYTCYTYVTSDGNTSVIYSDDGGKTWTRSADMSAQSSEATLVEADGTIYMFTRHDGYYYSTDNGATWSSKQTVSGISYTTSCQLNAMVYSEPIDGKTAILLSAPTSSRTTGKIFVGLVQEDGSISWDYTYSVNGSNTYQYSCMAELSDGTVALLYENGSASITYTTIDIEDIADGATIGSTITSESDDSNSDSVSGVTAVATGVTLSSISVVKTSTTTSDGSVNISYNVTLNGGDYTGSATLYIPLDDALADCNSFSGSVEETSAGEAADFDVTQEDGYLVCTVPHFSTITINGESVEYTEEVDVTLYVGQTATYEQTTGTDVVSEVDSDIATAEVASTTTTYDAQLGTDSSFDGDYTNLENALYTFTGSTSAGWVISNTTSDGTTVYVNIDNSSNGYPNNTTSDTLTLTYYSNGFTITNGSNRNLAFLDSTYSALYTFDEGNSGTNSTGVYQFYIYRQATDGEDSSTELPGYVKLTSLSGISSGSQYLIVAYRDGSYYVLYPSTSTSNKYSHVAKALGTTVTESSTTVSITGVSAGTTSTIVGTTLYNITVIEVTGYSSVTLAGGDSTTLAISSIDEDFTLEDGYTVTWTVEDTDVAGLYNTDGASTSLIAHAEDETTVTAEVYDADGSLVATYIWTVTVTSTYGSGSYTYTWSVTEVVYNGTLYYSIDGGELIEATDYTETTDSDGNTIRTYTITYTSTNVSSTGLLYFIKPDEGYAVTYVYDNTGKTYSNFYGTSDIASYYTKAAFLAAHSGVTHNGGWYTDIMTNAEWDAIIAQALAAGCDAIYWNTRGGITANGSYTGYYTNYCNKLPTVDKVITSLTRTVDGVETTITYVEGETEVKVGDVINYTVSITTYYETVDITYSNAYLTDTMSSGSGAAATFTDTDATNNGTVLAVTDDLGNGTTQSAVSQVAETYTVTYTVTEADLDSELLNTVSLSYDYQSTYSTGSYGGTASAECRVNLVSFTPYNIVVDFGLPVTIDYSGTEDHGSYNLVSGTATYGTVTVEGNKVTYTPTTVLTGVDTVTLVNEKNATYTFSVYPATTVYYEEGFASYGTGWGVTSGDNGWSNSTNTGKDSQETEIANTANNSYNNYNYDGAYKTDTTGSEGTAASTTTAADSLSFTFTGIGVDIFANCDENSGVVGIKVVDSKDSVKKTLTVDMADTGAYASGGTAYNIPIASISGLTHGTYTVTIYLGMVNSSGFKFDGFRVYGTIDESTDSATSAVYAADLEDNPSYYELRNYVLGTLVTDTTSSTYADDIANGVAQVYATNEVDKSNSAIVVYSSGSGIVETADENILDNGPKNELYLDSSASVVFKINTDREVQIGLRSVTGVSVTYTINDGSTTNTYTTSSSVDMFYTLQAKGTGEKTYTISVTSGGILSITDIKVSDSTEDSIFGSLTADEVVAALTGSASDEDEDNSGDEEEEEPAVFEPETFSVSTSVKTNSKSATVTVTAKTSEDVESITVNGTEVTSYKTVTERSGKGKNATTTTYRQFTYTETVTESGTYTYEVAAVSADGVASAATTATASVTIRSTGNRR